MADFESSRTLGKTGSIETARLVKLKADGASLLESRKALLEGAGVASGSRSKSSFVVKLAATIVSSGKIAKVPKVKVVVAKLASHAKRPISAGTKKKSQALLNASALCESGSGESGLDHGGLVEVPEREPSLEEGIPQHLLISGGGGCLQSLARVPSGTSDEEVEESHLPLPALIESEMDTCAITFLNLKKRECELLEIIEDSTECLLTTDTGQRYCRSSVV